jgi:hypothetical protein
MNEFTLDQLVRFGNYLLSTERTEQTAKGVTDADIEALAAAEDTRTTDQILAQELELLTNTLIKQFAPDQAAAVEAARTAARAGAGKTKISYDMSPEVTGAVDLVTRGISEVERLKTALLTAEAIEVQTMTVANGGATTTANDMLSPPSGYGTRTLTGPEGSIQLNNKDTVLAGTNLFDKSSTDNNALANTMLQVGAMIVAAIKSGGVNLNERYA